MIGWISDVNSNTDVFDNMDFVDTAPAFKDARAKIEYIIPAFIKYISGDRTKSKIYGQIKRFYPEELIYMDNNIVEHNIDKLQSIDTLIEDSCALTKDLRVVVIKDRLQLTSISGYEFISFTKGENHINTLFIEDKDIDIKFTFSICLKLFDNIIMSCLYDNKVPVNDGVIRLRYNGINIMQISRFIVDYMYELLYPFEKSLKLENDEIEALIRHISKSNHEILKEETLLDLYRLIVDTLRGRADNYDYIEFIIRIMKEIRDNAKSQINLPF